MSTLNVDKVDPSTGTALEIGSSGDTITIPSGATIVNSGTATGFGGGATQSSTWYVTAEYTPSADNEIISGWAESNAPGYNRLGTSPTESSDVFTMPATGWYWVTLNLSTLQATVASDTYSGAIHLSTDTGSNWEPVVVGFNRHIATAVGGDGRTNTIMSIVKVTNTTTDLIRFWSGGIKIANTNILGGTQDTEGGINSTTGTFTKLADI